MRARVCLYISRKIDPRSWKHTVHSADCQKIEIQHRHSRLRIINLYNPGPWDKTGTSTIDTLEHVVNRRSQEYIILGDFNLRHPAWNDPDARDTPDPGIWDADSDQPDGNTGRQSAPADLIDRYDPDAELTPEKQRAKGPNRQTRQDLKADSLLEFTDSRLLDLWLEPGTVTREFKNHRTTIDLVWGSRKLTNHFVACEVAPKIHADSDHLPIRILINIDIPEAQAPRRHN